MLDSGWLQVLSINCQTINDQHNARQINEHIKQGKSRACISFKNYQNTYDKIKQEIDYFIPSPSMEANRVASAETAIKIHNEYRNVFTEIGCFKALFLSRSMIT